MHFESANSIEPHKPFSNPIFPIKLHKIRTNKFQLCQISTQFIAIYRVYKLRAVCLFLSAIFSLRWLLFQNPNSFDNRVDISNTCCHILCSFAIRPIDSTHVCLALWLQSVKPELNRLTTSFFFHFLFLLSLHRLFCALSVCLEFLFRLKVIRHFFSRQQKVVNSKHS